MSETLTPERRMKEIVALQEHERGYSLFLAGGISGCPDWQKEMVALLSDCDFFLLNPRRTDFPIHDPNAAREQIAWEHRHLRKADTILFWFPSETLCPIVLFELGAWSMTDKTIFVGVHPDYLRRQDVEIQLSLSRPGLTISYSLMDLAQRILDTGLPRSANVQEEGFDGD